MLNSFLVGVLLGGLENLPDPPLVEGQRVGRVRLLPPAREAQPETLPATGGMGLRPGALHVIFLEQDLDQKGRSVRSPRGQASSGSFAGHRLAQKAVRLLLPLGPAV